MAYYYSHAEEVYFQKRLGGFYASYKSIDIDAFNDDPEDLDKNGKPDSENNAYFYSSGGDNGHVMLGHFKNWTSSSGESEAALSAEILVHELGHANLYHASQASRGNLTPFCSSTQTQGCIGAIHEGQADFHTFILFPQSPTAVGELLVNSTGGLSECGIPRSPDRLSKTGSNCTSNSGCFLTLSIANGISCGGGSREVHIMGRIYALIWYDAWISATDRREVEILFNEHLSKISYSDDFRTAVQKAMDVDRTLGNGSIATLLKQKAEGRGITGLN